MRSVLDSSRDNQPDVYVFRVLHVLLKKSKAREG